MGVLGVLVELWVQGFGGLGFLGVRGLGVLGFRVWRVWQSKGAVSALHVELLVSGLPGDIG